jgi:hypothetical protein
MERGENARELLLCYPISVLRNAVSGLDKVYPQKNNYPSKSVTSIVSADVITVVDNTTARQFCNHYSEVNFKATSNFRLLTPLDLYRTFSTRFLHHGKRAQRFFRSSQEERQAAAIY